MNQVTKFYLTSFLKNQTYFTPILIIFLQSAFLSYKEIFLVFTIGSVISYLIEVPTGIFADLYGKRKSIIISKFGILLSYIFFFFSNSFLMFVIAQAIYEIANSFKTGTETAYIYDYLEENKGRSLKADFLSRFFQKKAIYHNEIKVPTYTEVKGKQKFYARISESIATLLGGFIAGLISFRIVFLFAAFPAILNMFVAISWDKIKEHEEKVTLKSSLKHAKDSMTILKNNKNLIKVTINITLFYAVVSALGKFIQPYMVSINLPIESFGIIYSIFLGIAAFLVRYSHKLELKFGKRNVINYLSFFAFIPALVLGLGYKGLAGVLFFFIIIIIENLRSPIANHEFHSLVSSRQRATLGSILAQSKSLGKILMLPVAGFLADAYSIKFAILVMSLVLLVNGVFFYIRKSDEIKS